MSGNGKASTEVASRLSSTVNVKPFRVRYEVDYLIEKDGMPAGVFTSHRGQITGADLASWMPSLNLEQMNQEAEAMMDSQGLA